MTVYYPGGCWADNDDGRRAADGTTEACGAVAVCDLLLLRAPSGGNGGRAGAIRGYEDRAVSRPVPLDLAWLGKAVAASQGWRQPSRLFSREAYEAMTDAEQAKTRWSADPMLLGRLCIAERASATAMRHEMSHPSRLVWRSQVERSVDQWRVDARSR